MLVAELFGRDADNVVKCTGIMTLVLSDRSMLVRLRGMNLAHVDKIVEAQDDLKPLELAYVACKSSYDAQMKALVGTRYLVEKWRVLAYLSSSSRSVAMSERIEVPRRVQF